MKAAILYHLCFRIVCLARVFASPKTKGRFFLIFLYQLVSCFIIAFLKAPQLALLPLLKSFLRLFLVTTQFKSVQRDLMRCQTY